MDCFRIRPFAVQEILIGAALLAAASLLGSRTAEGAVPTGGPPALYAPEPALPAPAGWPFGEDFPRTSGVGRTNGGALFWSDFLYDDQGAIGFGGPQNQSSGAPSRGTYKYTEADAAANGADLFRVAIGADATDTYWRVDWNTLIDVDLPAAAFAVDTDANTLTGAAAWAANAALNSPGIDRVLFVSSAGAWLHDLVTVPAPPPVDIVAAGGGVSIDAGARSFVVRVPRSIYDPSGTSSVYAAGGLSNGTGDAFLQLDNAHGALAGQPNVYNMAFRDYADEEPSAWFDDAQSVALTANDASPFDASVDWAALVAGTTNPEPLVTGYVNRWYVSSIEPFQGIGSGGEPVYGGRVQPYMAYIPTTYSPANPPPLTWWLHGAFSNHNSQPSNSPNYLQQACEARGSICVSTEGRGPSGGYNGVAELDYWEVWRSVDADFGLDPDRTIQSGYSMGGFGSYKLINNHPDLYAAVVIQASAATGITNGSGDIDRLENIRYLPYYHAHGGLDQLVPVVGAIQTVDALDALDYRHRFDLYPAVDHVAYAIQDSYEDAAQFMTEQGTRPPDGEYVNYAWFPDAVDPLGRFGPTGAFWVQGAVARDENLELARIVARSLAKPDPSLTIVRTETPRPDASPSPADRRELEWVLGPPAAAEKRMTLDLQNAGALTLDLVRAGLVGAGSVGDWDGDGVADGADNCPAAPNADQADNGGLATSVPDGVGDACQCGDVSANGQANGLDANAIRRFGLGIEPNPLFVDACRCDVTGNGLCNGQDGNALSRAALGLAGPFDATACSAFSGVRVIDVVTDGASDITLAALVPGTQVALDGIPVGSAAGDGTLLVPIPAGMHRIEVSP